MGAHHGRRGMVAHPGLTEHVVSRTQPRPAAIVRGRLCDYTRKIKRMHLRYPALLAVILLLSSCGGTAAPASPIGSSASASAQAEPASASAKPAASGGSAASAKPAA